MTDSDGQDSHPTRRAYATPNADAVEYRDAEADDGVFEVRMPIATTGEVRNQGDDPLSRDELDGMGRQIDESTVGVFLDHGGTDLGGRSRYAAVEKVGEWQDATVRTREDGESDADELVATARIMDPETLPAATGALRETLAAIKEQVQRDMSLSASIGWRDDESFPGGVDLMEASIVGIGADPRTTSDADAVALARAAHAASEADDPEAVVDRFREVTRDMTDDTDESDTEADAEQGEQTEESRDQDLLERLVELQEQQMDTLEAIEQSIREDDDDGDDDEDAEENESDAEGEDEEENAADEPDEEQSLREEVAELRDQLDEFRSGDGDVETPDAEPESEQDADADEAEDEPTATETRSNPLLDPR